MTKSLSGLTRFLTLFPEYIHLETKESCGLSEATLAYFAHNFGIVPRDTVEPQVGGDTAVDIVSKFMLVRNASGQYVYERREQASGRFKLNPDVFRVYEFFWANHASLLHKYTSFVENHQ